MEKRDFNINYGDLKVEKEENKDIYTFIIPNSNIENIDIPAYKNKKKKEKKTTKN